MYGLLPAHAVMRYLLQIVSTNEKTSAIITGEPAKTARKRRKDDECRRRNERDNYGRTGENRPETKKDDECRQQYFGLTSDAKRKKTERHADVCFILPRHRAGDPAQDGDG